MLTAAGILSPGGAIAACMCRASLANIRIEDNVIYTPVWLSFLHCLHPCAGNFCQPNCAEPWTEVVFSNGTTKISLMAVPLKKLSNARNVKLEDLVCGMGGLCRALDLLCGLGRAEYLYLHPCLAPHASCVRVGSFKHIITASFPPRSISHPVLPALGPIPPMPFPTLILVLPLIPTLSPCCPQPAPTSASCRAHQSQCSPRSALTSQACACFCLSQNSAGLQLV